MTILRFFYRTFLKFEIFSRCRDPCKIITLTFLVTWWISGAREVIEVEVIDAEVIEAVVIEGGSYRGRRLLREEVIEGGGYRGRKLLREEFIEVEFIEGGSY